MLETVRSIERPWDAVERLADDAEHVVIAAPYIKEDALRRLLALVSDGVALTCITRWQYSDVTRGVSDVSCRSLVVECDGQFLLHQRLHAKYYRFGNNILVGSANLTASGMGYTSPANAEILCAPGVGFDPMAFEQELLGSAREVSDREFARWSAITRQLESAGGVLEPEALTEWMPLTREPSNVWLFYSGHTSAVVSEDERVLAVQDLKALGLPANLDRPGFDVIVTAALLSSAAVADVMRTDTMTDEEAWTQLATTWGTTKSEAQRYRETAWNWIATFLDDSVI